MPRAFTQEERQMIQAKLLQAGQDYFVRFGIRKTNVEDLTRAAGISKGAFYLFYDSKEELFFEVLEAFEAELREKIFAFVLNPRETSRANFAELLRDALLIWEGSPFFSHFSREDYDLLVRRLPLERIQQHSQEDEAFLAQILARWQAAGLEIRRDPKIVSGLMKALFYVSLHKEDLGPQSYAPTLEILVDLVAGYLVGEEKRE